MLHTKNMVPLLMLIFSLNHSHGMQTAPACPPHRSEKMVIVLTQDSKIAEIPYAIAIREPLFRLLKQDPHIFFLQVSISLYELMEAIKKLEPTAEFNILSAD